VKGGGSEIDTATSAGRKTPEREKLSGRQESVMTHKYRGCIVVLSINKSVEPNEE
jgi:hypothetical protein